MKKILRSTQDDKRKGEDGKRRGEEGKRAAEAGKRRAQDDEPAAAAQDLRSGFIRPVSTRRPILSGRPTPAPTGTRNLISLRPGIPLCPVLFPPDSSRLAFQEAQLALAIRSYLPEPSYHTCLFPWLWQCERSSSLRQTALKIILPKQNRGGGAGDERRIPAAG
jgi:hypothetical protein